MPRSSTSGAPTTRTCGRSSKRRTPDRYKVRSVISEGGFGVVYEHPVPRRVSLGLQNIARDGTCGSSPDLSSDSARHIKETIAS